MSATELASVVAAVLMAGVAAFQVALAMGAPLGEATMGGRAATVHGRLARPYRIVAALSAGVLLVGAWIVLARAGVVAPGFLGEDVPVWGTWVIVAFSALNALANLMGRHPLERWGMSSIAAAVVLLVGYVALTA